MTPEEAGQNRNEWSASMNTVPIVEFKDWTTEERENPFGSKRIIWEAEHFWNGPAPQWETFFPAGQLSQIPHKALTLLVSYVNAYATQSEDWSKTVGVSDYKRDPSLKACATEENILCDSLHFRMYLVKSANDKRTNAPAVSEKVFIWLHSVPEVVRMPVPSP